MRNLLHGRAVAGAFGPVSRVAYVPDSFGHPAQFPQLFAGFGLDPFVYWRGNGTEIDALAPLLPLARARRQRRSAPGISPRATSAPAGSTPTVTSPRPSARLQTGDRAARRGAAWIRCCS